MAFALMVITAGFIVAFSSELSEFCQAAWENKPSRNYFLMFLFSLFGIQYIHYVKHFFLLLIRSLRYVVQDISEPLSNYDGAEGFALLIITLVFTYTISFFIAAIYYVAFGEKSPYFTQCTSVIWLFSICLVIFA